jgi:hypothetical protein
MFLTEVKSQLFEASRHDQYLRILRKYQFGMDALNLVLPRVGMFITDVKRYLTQPLNEASLSQKYLAVLNKFHFAMDEPSSRTDDNGRVWYRFVGRGDVEQPRTVMGATVGGVTGRFELRVK